MEDLARLSFKHKPLYVGVDDSRSTATREGLEQGYCVVPGDKRFLLLFTFLKKNLHKKVSGGKLGRDGAWGVGGIGGEEVGGGAGGGGKGGGGRAGGGEGISASSTWPP